MKDEKKCFLCHETVNGLIRKFEKSGSLFLPKSKQLGCELK